MSYLLEGLPRVLRSAGLKFTVASDASTNRLRDENIVDVRGLVVHSTETANSSFSMGSDAPTWNYARYGLGYPIYNILIGRSGHVYIATFGQAAHAGTGVWPLKDRAIPRNEANRYSIGIALDSNKSKYPPTTEQLESLARVLYYLEKDWGWKLSIAMHGEYNPASRSDPTRVDWTSIRGAAKRGYWSSPYAVSSTPKPTIVTPATVLETIDPGETLWAISKRYSVPLADIRKVNPGLDEKNLKIGSRIKIPAQNLYIIQSGDTLYKIADRLGLTTKALINLNPEINPDKINPDKIMPGQILRIE